MPKIMIIGCGRLGQIIGNFFQINNFSVVGIRRSKVEPSKFPMHAYDIFSNEFDIFFTSKNRITLFTQQHPVHRTQKTMNGFILTV